MTDWRDEAECDETISELFFPVSYISTIGLYQVQVAKQICRRCPVLAQCRDYILDFEGGANAEGRTGIFAGLTPKERHAAYRRSTRARETAAA